MDNISIDNDSFDNIEEEEEEEEEQDEQEEGGREHEPLAPGLVAGGAIEVQAGEAIATSADNDEVGVDALAHAAAESLAIDSSPERSPEVSITEYLLCADALEVVCVCVCVRVCCMQFLFTSEWLLFS